MAKTIDVYIIGCKGIPAKYGGFETFVEELTKGKVSSFIKYHVSCMNNEECHFDYNDADCFNVKVPLNGPVGRILHVSRALGFVEKTYNPNNKNIVYILGCRIGPFIKKHFKKLKKRGFEIFVNPDGLEWKRDKWNSLEKRFLKYCEKCLVKYSDLVVCDSKNIEKYINDNYCSRTKYLAYGCYVGQSKCSSDSYNEWKNKNNISSNGYYLIVGRFVPENNYETMIREFLNSKTNKDLVIVSNVAKNRFFNHLLKTTHFDADSRIKFVGTVYDRELLLKIRENAYAYFHGHEVGGTNPSLLEALGSTKVNMVLDVGFNREVCEDGALYWNKNTGDLSRLIDEVDRISISQMNHLSSVSKERVIKFYCWPVICESYEELFINGAFK